MKLIKVFGLAAIAAVAAMALIGASSASATQLCLKLTEAKTCSEPKTEVNGVASKANDVFTSGFITVKCKGLAHTVVTNEAGVLTVKATSTLTFTECEGCKKVTATVSSATVMFTSADSGEVVGSGETSFEECLFGEHCKYSGNSVKLSVDGSETNALLLAVGVELKRAAGSGAFCSETGKWNATFEGETAKDKMSILAL